MVVVSLLPWPVLLLAARMLFSVSFPLCVTETLRSESIVCVSVFRCVCDCDRVPPTLYVDRDGANASSSAVCENHTT